jgi:hypothetical protein
MVGKLLGQQQGDQAERAWEHQPIAAVPVDEAVAHEDARFVVLGVDAVDRLGGGVWILGGQPAGAVQVARGGLERDANGLERAAMGLELGEVGHGAVYLGSAGSQLSSRPLSTRAVRARPTCHRPLGKYDAPVDAMLGALEAAVADGRRPQTEVAALFRAAKTLDHSGLRDLLDRLDIIVPAYPAEHAAMVAVLSGAIVEIGGAPESLPTSIFDRLVELLDAMRPPSEGDEAEEELPECFYMFEQAAIAALSRSAPLRRQLPQREAIRMRLRSYNTRYGFLGKMVEVLDDELLLVLHPSTRRGWDCRASGIGDNFQLHLLLLAALAGSGASKIEGEVPSASAVAASTSGRVDKDESVGSTWQLANWHALREEGAIESDGKQVSRCWIWNEGFPAEIARFDGTRVILVGPSSYHRGWLAGRVFPAMDGSLQVERPLATAEAASLLDRMLARLMQIRAAQE